MQHAEIQHTAFLSTLKHHQAQQPPPPLRRAQSPLSRPAVGRPGRTAPNTRASLNDPPPRGSSRKKLGWAEEGCWESGASATPCPVRPRPDELLPLVPQACQPRVRHAEDEQDEQHGGLRVAAHQGFLRGGGGGTAGWRTGIRWEMRSGPHQSPINVASRAVV